jgi:hypothetical protein
LLPLLRIAVLLDAHTFEFADGLPPLGANVSLAAGEASNESPVDDRVDWNEIQSEGSSSSEGESEIPLAQDPEAGGSSRVPEKEVILVDDEDGDDDDAPLRVRHRSTDAAKGASKAMKPPGGASTRQASLHQAPAVQTWQAFARSKRVATGKKMAGSSTPPAPAARAGKRMKLTAISVNPT